MDDPDYIKELKAQFRSTIQDKLLEFESLIQNYSQNRTEETLESFRMAVHKLAGSAGSYGYMEASDLCKKLERRILEDKIHFIANDSTRELNDFFQKLRASFEEKKEPPPEEFVPIDIQEESAPEEAPPPEIPVALQQLSEEFSKNVGDQLKEIEGELDNLLIHPNEEKIWFLKDRIHRLAATATGYHLIELGKALSSLEGLIQKDLHRWLQKTLTKSNVDELREKINHVHAIYNKTPIEAKEIVIQTDLFVLIDDPSFISQIKHEGSLRGMVVEGENDPAMVSHHFKNPKFRPIFLLIDETFLEMGGGSSLVEQYQKSHQDGGVIGLILKESTLENRIKAMKANINYVFSYPLSIKALLDLAESLAIGEQSGKFKVVVLDDDIKVCEQIKEQLGTLDIETEVFYDAKNLFPILERAHPDLLILDADLPDSNAIDLLKVIRHDAFFRDLPVVLLAEENNEQGIEAALREGIETFITKPINLETFVSRIGSIAKMHLGQRMSQEKDLETGFYQYGAFMQLLSRFFRRAGSESASHTLALIGISHYESLQEEDQQFAQSLTLSLAGSLSNHFRSVELKGRIRRSVFAMLFENTRQLQVKESIEAFLQKFKDEPFMIYHKEKKVATCAGIATFPHDGMSSDIVFKCAQEAMYEAEAFESLPVLTFSKVSSEEEQLGEICVIDDDEDVRHLLQFAIEKEGFRIRVLKGFAEAVKYFEENKAQELPRLVIFDRLLPDGDGMDLFRKLKAEIPNFPPALFLSTLSSEADVVEGLREGAVDYIIKPFALPVLMEKLKRILGKKGGSQ